VIYQSVQDGPHMAAINRRVRELFHSVFRYRWFPALILFLLLPAISWAQGVLPQVRISFGASDDPQSLIPALQILALITILSLAPSILIMMTSFTRLIIVFHFLRSALASQTVPSNQVLVGLALFITVFIMKPVFIKVNEEALQPYLNKQITEQEAVKRAVGPFKAFMLRQVRSEDLEMFIDLRHAPRPKSPADLSMATVIPAFLTSELRTAFQIGFLLYLPMLVIDIIVSGVLLSMGMLMLPPVMISMPFKILLFVLVDGWHLIIESLVRSFGG